MSISSGDSRDLESPGMTLVQKLKVAQMSFGQVADMVFKNILFSGSRSKRTDMVFDVYLENSIKIAESFRRGISTIQYQSNFTSNKGHTVKEVPFFIIKQNKIDFIPWRTVQK